MSDAIDAAAREIAKEITAYAAPDVWSVETARAFCDSVGVRISAAIRDHAAPKIVAPLPPPVFDESDLPMSIHAPRWIRFGERKPEEGQSVIVWPLFPVTRGPLILVMKWIGSESAKPDDLWMPLPSVDGTPAPASACEREPGDDFPRCDKLESALRHIRASRGDVPVAAFMAQIDAVLSKGMT